MTNTITVILIAGLLWSFSIALYQKTQAAVDVELLLPVFDNFTSPNCLPAALVEQRLRQKYREELVSTAITSDGKHLVERWESSETGSWTLLFRTRRGLLCVISVGEDWQEKPISLRGMPT